MSLPKNIDVDKWDKLIKEHYQSILIHRPDYPYTREEHKKFWYDKLDIKTSYVTEEDIETFILGSTHANNNGVFYHPV